MSHSPGSLIFKGCFHWRSVHPARPASAWRPKCQITACHGNRRHGGEAEISMLPFMLLYIVFEKERGQGQDARNTPPGARRQHKYAGTKARFMATSLTSSHPGYLIIMVWLHHTWSRSTGGKRGIRTGDKRGYGDGGAGFQSQGPRRLPTHFPFFFLPSSFLASHS